MLKNYWITALRSYLKRFTTTSVLFIGLTISITSFIFISVFVFHEKNFDKFHEKGERIFRVQQNRYSKNELSNSSANTNFGVGRDITTDFPEVVDNVIIIKNISILIHDGELFKEEKSAYVSESFFNVFSFNLTKGNDSLVLSRPYTIVLSETLARKIFKEEDPIGKTVNYRGRFDVEVTGVFQDMPENSHLNFHVLIPIATYEKLTNKFVLEEPWRWDGFFTYILLKQATQRERVEQKLPDLIERKTGNWLRETSQKLDLNLQPLFDIHLESNFSDELSQNGNHQTVLFISIVALFLLVIAWINYVSLATVQSLNRAKEVGVRKVLGSSQIQLIKQFLSEAFILNLFSVFLALLLVYAALPDFSALVERNISTEFLTLPLFWVFIIGLLITSTFVSGLYPAFIISAVPPVEILKGKYSSNQSGKLLRKMTVFLPFLVTVVLLIGLFGVYTQLEFLKNRELGFDPKNKMVVRGSEIYDSLYESRATIFKKEVKKITGVEHVTFVSSLPGEIIIPYANSVQRIGADKEDVNQYRYFTVDENFIETLQLSVIAGRSFDPTGKVNKEVMINESASTLLGFNMPEDAIDQRIFFRDDTVMVKAVIRDYHHEAPKVRIPPTIYLNNPSSGNYYILSMSTSNHQATTSVAKLFSEIFPGQPCNHFLLTEKYGSQYRADEKLAKIIIVFTILLLIITCSGIFSLSSYIAKLRTKEIGIRKVLGATEGEAIYVMVKEYIFIVLAAILIGAPIAYLGLNNWLQAFPVQTKIHWWLFVIPSGMILIIAILTVLGQTLKAVYTNPALTLQSE